MPAVCPPAPGSAARPAITRPPIRLANPRVPARRRVLLRQHGNDRPQSRCLPAAPALPSRGTLAPRLRRTRGRLRCGHRCGRAPRCERRALTLSDSEHPAKYRQTVGYYSGAATIIAADGSETTVEVRLTRSESPHGFGSWRGTAVGPVDWFALQGSDDVRIRIGDRSAKVIVSWWAGSARANLTGSGDSPFD
jgi:hypothetical protein